MQIHRIIKENLRKGLTEKRISHYDKILPEVSIQSSKMERRADEAEREVEKMKKAEYMKQFIGQTFEGIISGITTWGMYVELENTVEGMVKVTSMHDDYYYYDEENYMMVGEHTKKMYKLGEKVMIRVMDVDKLTKTVDFALVTGDLDDEKEAEAMALLARYNAISEEINQSAVKKKRSAKKSVSSKRSASKKVTGKKKEK